MGHERKVIEFDDKLNSTSFHLRSRQDGCHEGKDEMRSRYLLPIKLCLRSYMAKAFLLQ